MRRVYVGLTTPLSIDLVAAVIRQREFTKKMVNLNLDVQEILLNCTKRYFMFLMIMKHSRYKKAAYVPTLDIGQYVNYVAVNELSPCTTDLGWHTHALFAPLYRAYTLKALGHICNHDDTLDKGSLNTSLAAAAEQWYNVHKEYWLVFDKHCIILLNRAVHERQFAPQIPKHPPSFPRHLHAVWRLCHPQGH
ncbi:hypothetical protein BC936DRAFT_144505 [Jimgerdemannia flammicorona]|uniref:Uncharacterized protein n=1 Tax=Jimgerdemannia flammicorona TaxID=994334 RepID=A0A432ZY15_9FUNG|nr:hypothetical protein BC936DRAFT_144505 [Jimgerdemannia flammicorona]